MYFRTKFIKGTPLVQLVESYRNNEGQPRQRVLASLGDAQVPEGEKKGIVEALEDHLRGAQGLLDSELSAEGAAWVTRIAGLLGRSKAAKPLTGATVDGVLVDKVQTSEGVQLGPQLVALQGWKELGLSRMLEEMGLNVSQIATAQLMVSNRLIEPLSEWALIDWAERTALPEILGIRVTKTTKDRLYQVSDTLLTHRKSIEEKLRAHEADLFSLSRSVILYDVTNTHFEGIAKKNPKARHGKNKQHRNDCRQVAVGMAFDEYGLPLAHEVFEGNIADTKTLEVVLNRLEVPEEGLKPVVILDAGFASAANIALLKERGYSYLVNITRGSRAKYAEVFEKESFQVLPGRVKEEMIEVRQIDDPQDPGSHLLLCRSAQRRLKEEAMISKAEARFLVAVKSLGKSIESGRLKKGEIIERKIGALLKKHPRLAKLYTLLYREGTLTAVRQEEKMSHARSLCGDYVLKTDKTLEAPQIWSLYMTLLKAEEGFCMLKGSLGLRPNYHQLEGRVEGHIFISVLAYHLLSWIRRKLEPLGDTRDWINLRRLLSTHSLTTTSLPLADGRLIQIRKAGVPDADQSLVYKRLGIDWKNAFPTRKSILKP